MPLSGSPSLDQPARLALSFDRQIFRRQPRGGISRYFNDLIHTLSTEPTVALAPSNQATVLHATFYGGRPHRKHQGQQLVSSLFDMTPELHPEYFPLSRFRSPHANKLTWLQHSDGIISISQASANDLCFFKPQLADRIKVIHLATQMDTITPEPVTGLIDRPFWLMVGKRRGYKNGHILIRAIRRLRGPRQGEHVLVLAGGEPWSKEEQQHWQIDDATVTFMPVVARDHQLAWLYRHAQAVLVPSMAEGFSLPLIEALVCDTPVIASDLEAHREVAGEFATLAPALNAAAWADCLHASYQSRQRPSEILGARRYQELCSYFNIQRMAQEHIEHYRSLMA